MERPHWEPRTYGPITVEYRPTNQDFRAHLTGDRRIWAAGRNPYEAVGDLVVHHPERFATQAAVAEQSAEVERLRALSDDLAGLLEMVLNNQIRNGWVAEGSPLLETPRAVLTRWADERRQ